VGSVEGWGALDGGGDRRRRWVSFGVNLGRPIVTDGDFVAYLCGVRAVIELSFGVVSRVGPCSDVRNGGPHGSRGRVDFWVVCLYCPVGSKQ